MLLHLKYIYLHLHRATSSIQTTSTQDYLVITLPVEKKKSMNYFLITYNSPERWSKCLIHLLLTPPFPPATAETCAISNPSPTGRNTDLTTRRREASSSTTLRHLNLEKPDLE